MTTPFAPVSDSGGKVRVGTAGWSYDDWEGIVYPPHKARFDALAYLVHYFDTIEVNSSFYRVPPESHAKSWVRRCSSNPDFRFTVKLFRGFTHEREATKKDHHDFSQFLTRIAEESRLGALLLQFPMSFRLNPENLAYMDKLLAAFNDFPRVVEVRHASFANQEFFEFLDERHCGFANIDQPLFTDCIRPSEVVTGNLSYVRFHGRNYGKWFAHEEAWERYDYLYSKKELTPWIERIGTMAAKSDVYVITNNHFRGQAVVNAIDVKRALGQPVEIPPPLLDAYANQLSSGESGE